MHTHDMASLKQHMEADKLLKDCMCYIQEFKPLIERLVLETTRLTRMHLAGSKA